MENKTYNSTQTDAAPVRGAKAKPERNTSPTLIPRIGLFAVSLGIAKALDTLEWLPPIDELNELKHLLDECFRRVTRLFGNDKDAEYISISNGGRQRRKKVSTPATDTAAAANTERSETDAQ